MTTDAVALRRVARSYYPWLVWGLAAAYFFADYFARVSPGVMIPDLMEGFSVSALGLGSLTAFFYYPYVAMQIPVGLLVDRFGVRLLLTIMALLVGVGCLVFANAETLYMGKLGRFLMGFGAAFAFVSALKLASTWFPFHRFGLLAGLTQALGMLGAAVGAAPVGYFVHQFGWRHTMASMAVIFFVLAALILSLVRNRPSNLPNTVQAMPVETQSIWCSLGQVLRNPQSWWNGLYVGLLFAPTAAFAELWGAVYLEHVQGLSPLWSAFANGLIFIGWGIGGPLMGWFSDHLGRRRPVMFFSAVMGLLLMSAILYLPDLTPFSLFLLLLLFGMSNAGVAIAYAVAAEINPRSVVGTSMSYANMMSVIIGASLQPLIGFLIDLTQGSNLHIPLALHAPSDFKQAMLLLPLSLLLAVVCTFFIRETYCQPLERRV